MANKAARKRKFKKATRSYTDRNLKLLFGLSGMTCALPNCRRSCHVPGESGDPDTIVGQIAHIEAFANDGPRANPNLSVPERNKYENLMLLCSGCNTLIDSQPSHYTVERLRLIKADHERWVRERLADDMQLLTDEGLELVTKHLLKKPLNVTSDFTTLIDPKEKVKRNDLSSGTEDMLVIGLLKAKDVEEFLKRMQQVVPTFPDDLREVLVREYKRLHAAELRSDALFLELHDFVSQRSSDQPRRTAALAIVSHFFTTCDIFES